MSKQEKIYKEIQKEFSGEEIVERYVFADELSKEEREEVEKEFRQIRLKSLKERTEGQRILSELMRMKLLIRDYLERFEYEEEYSFSSQLKQYVQIINRTHKEFANEVNLHPTKLSRLLNEREAPNIELMYRLEKHCGEVIPAIYWWKLYSKKLEEEIRNDTEKRKEEREKVTNNLRFRA